MPSKIQQMKTDILYLQEDQEIMGFTWLGKKITGKLRTEILIRATWMNLEDIMLSEISQTQ